MKKILLIANEVIIIMLFMNKIIARILNDAHSWRATRNQGPYRDGR